MTPSIRMTFGRDFRLLISSSSIFNFHFVFAFVAILIRSSYPTRQCIQVVCFFSDLSDRITWRYPSELSMGEHRQRGTRRTKVTTNISEKVRRMSGHHVEEDSGVLPCRF